MDSLLKFTNDDEKILLLKSRIGTNINKNELVKILPQLESLSHAEINQACLDAIKESVLDDKKIDINLIEKTIRERKMAYNI